MQTLNPKPQTENSKMQTLNPKPHTENSKMQTLNPKPSVSELGSKTRFVLKTLIRLEFLDCQLVF